MYPQVEIVPTSGGMDQAGRVEKYADKQERKAEREASIAAKINSRSELAPRGDKAAAIARVTDKAGPSPERAMGRAAR